MAIRTVRGILTPEGHECQALRANTGELFTLLGDLGGFKNGDRVGVIGVEAEFSHCMQGTTLGILSIASDPSSAAMYRGAGMQHNVLALAGGGGEVPSPFGGASFGPEVPFPFWASSATKKRLGRGKYQCVRWSNFIVITAEGTCQWSEAPKIEMMPWRIQPPQFALYVYAPEAGLTEPRKFVERGFFLYPRNEKSLVIHDLDGAHTVQIEAPNVAIAEKDTETLKTGYSPVSLQHAFDEAINLLSAKRPKKVGSATYTLQRSGLMHGGFVGIRLYFAEVEATFVQ